MKLFFRNLKPFAGILVIAMIMLGVQAYTSLKLPDLMSDMVNAGIKATNSKATDFIWGKGVEMILVTLVGAGAAVLVSFIAAIIGTGISRNLRKEVFEKVTSFSQGEFNNFSTASLITRNTNDISQVQMVSILGIRLLCYSPILGIGGIVMALRKSTSLGWIIAVSLLVVFLIIGMLFILITPKFKRLQKLTDKINLIARENLTGLLIIRAFNAKDHELERFNESNKNLRSVSRIIMGTMGGLFPTMMFVMNATAVAILWYGGKSIDMGNMQVGDMIAFIQYSMQIIMSFLLLTMVFVLLPRAGISLSRLQEVLETPVEIFTTDDREPVGYTVEFNDVCFKYGDAEKNVIDHITFTAEEGKTTAIIGSTGSGKSTILQLIPRLFDVTCGNVTIGGVDVRRMDLKKLRDMIGYVPQKGMLFKGTFASNLRFGDPRGSDDAVRKALAQAQAMDFVSENGIEGEVSQGGANLSGGQKQRIAIARALIKNAPIYIFDDTFSALDYKTDRELRMALRNEMSDATVIMVAQRVSMIKDADRIIVLDNGEIVGQGTHDYLINNCPVYIEIAKSQPNMEIGQTQENGNNLNSQADGKGGEINEQA
ncbi:MAG: ABC transporter ATP-binding protein [Clostridiales bacterium]|nr:ABC transporter ATP-binding protein [Clostridiales bacterium]